MGFEGHLGVTLPGEVAAPTHGKPWWKSKTLLLNLLAAALLAAEPQFHLLQSVLPGNVYAVLAIALTVANAMLRVVTSQPVRMR